MTTPRTAVTAALGCTALLTLMFPATSPASAGADTGAETGTSRAEEHRMVQRRADDITVRTVETVRGHRTADGGLQMTVDRVSAAPAASLQRYGRTNPPDSNDYAPEYYNLAGCYDGIIGRAYYYRDGSVWYGPHVWYIRYDRCEMNRLGATSAGWGRLKAHERAHTRGWGHYEAPARYNAAYNPRVDIR